MHSILSGGLEIPVVYFFLLRFPVLCLIFLISFPFIALRLKPSLLANIFDLDGKGMIWTTMTALLCSWAIFLTGWDIFSYGPLRFGIGHWEHLGPPAVWGYALASVAAWVCLSGVFFYAPVQNPSRGNYGLWIGLLIGTALATSVLVAMRWIRAWLDNVKPEFQPLTWICRLIGTNGYLDENGRLFPEHVVALSMFVLSFAVYVALGLLKSRYRGRPSGIPTLVYVLLLLMLATWVMPALSFALDPYHVPVLITLIAWLFLTSRSPRTDHFYRAHRVTYSCSGDAELHSGNCAPSPSEVLLFPEDGKVIVVAASGGGIQAAAWTARVLAGLEEQNPGRFSRAIRLISSVSGGSVGSMYFCGRYKEDGSVTRDLHEVVEDAQTSSLEDVAWGLVYPDLWRVLFPSFVWKHGGRGRALETAWVHSPRLKHLLQVSLTSWCAGVRLGMRPANIFNATLVETGDRLLLSTTYLPVGRPSTPPARWDFHQLYLNKEKRETLDVDIATAARLSATFPYVTPASRIDQGGPNNPQFHVVDGGYYDNYGVSTLLEWLDNGLTTLRQAQNDGGSARFAKLKIMIVEIHEAPDPHRLVPEDIRQKRSWFFQIYAPLTTLFSVRTAAQRSHNQVDLELMRQKWGDKIEHVLFEFGTPDPTHPVSADELKGDLPSEESTRKIKLLSRDVTKKQASLSAKSKEELNQAVAPPLSWHLTELQKQNLDKEWALHARAGQAQEVRAFLTSMPLA